MEEADKTNCFVFNLFSCTYFSVPCVWYLKLSNLIPFSETQFWKQMFLSSDILALALCSGDMKWRALPKEFPQDLEL